MPLPSNFEVFIKAFSLSFPLGFILIGLGVFIAFFSIGFYRTSLYMSVGLGTTILIVFLIYIIPVRYPSWIGFIFLSNLCNSLLILIVLGIAGGVAVAYFVMLKRRGLAKFMVGAIGGAALAVFINVVVTCYITFYIFFIVLPALMVVGAFLIKFLGYKQGYIVSTAVFGSSLIARGISGIFGGYPNDLIFYDRYYKIKEDYVFTYNSDQE